MAAVGSKGALLMVGKDENLDRKIGDKQWARLLDAWGRCVGDAAPKVRMSEVWTFLLLTSAECVDVSISSQRFTAAASLIHWVLEREMLMCCRCVVDNVVVAVKPRALLSEALAT